jgi:release factor glutamine methyltransferase
VWGAARLRRAGPEPAHAPLEAEVLLRHAAGLSREEMLARPDAALPPAVRLVYTDLITRRTAGTPVAYLVGHREFFGADLVVDGGVMIPRPETERLVELLLDHLRDHPAPLIADIGTGSGAIAIAAARALPRARVLATDASPAALEVMRLNAARCGVADRIVAAEGRNLDPLERFKVEGAVDAVAANPPYIPTAELAHLPKEVRDHEPTVALDGGPDGLSVHRPIIAASGRYLVPGGLLVLEVAAVWDQARTVAQLIDATGLFTPPQIVRDYSDAERVVLALRDGRGGDHRR